MHISIHPNKKNILTLALVLNIAGVSIAQDKPASELPPALPPVPGNAASKPASSTKPVSFRASGASLNSENPAPAREIAQLPEKAGRGDLEELMDRRDSLEGEVRFAKKKIETSRKNVDVFQAVGKVEEADRANSDIKDWEARLKNSREQLAQVESEIGKLQRETDETPATSGEEVILPANNLEVFVNEDTSYNGRYQVRRGGYIILPQVGRVMVGGKTIAQAETAVRKALQATQLRKATVMIERFEGVNDEPGPLIYLSGEFKNARPYRIPPGTAPTLVSVILSAGGVTDQADLTHVKVMRMAANRSVVEEVNVKKIMQGDSGGLASDLTLTEGDVVVVPSGASNLIYVTGNVKKAGSFRVSEGEKLTVYGAILQSGGFGPWADKSKVHLLRSLPDGSKAKLPVSIKDVEKGRRPDVVMQANDIIVVPEKWFAW
jgi:polysaccharide biosynthesis/export protein